MIADRNHREQKISAHPDDRQVARALAHHQEQVFRGIDSQRRWRIAGGHRKTLSRIANDAAVIDIDGCDPAGSRVRKVEQAGVRRHRA